MGITSAITVTMAMNLPWEVNMFRLPSAPTFAAYLLFRRPSVTDGLREFLLRAYGR